MKYRPDIAKIISEISETIDIVKNASDDDLRGIIHEAIHHTENFLISSKHKTLGDEVGFYVVAGFVKSVIREGKTESVREAVLEALQYLMSRAEARLTAAPPRVLS